MNHHAGRSLAGLALFAGAIAFFFGLHWTAGAFVVFAALQFSAAFDTPVSLGGGKIVLTLLGITWTIDEILTHIVVLGRSGCGKTVAIFRTILIQLLRNIPGCGGVIIDGKADLHYIVDRIFQALKIPTRLIVIRVPLPDEAAKLDEPPLRMNLIADRGIPWDTYAQLVIDVAVSQGQKTTQPFFKTQGRPTIAAIFETIEAAGITPTLDLAYQFIAEKRARDIILEKIQLAPTERGEELVAFWFARETKAPEEWSGIKSTVENYLQPYSTRHIAEVFSSQDPNLDFLDIDKAKWLMPSVPQLYLNARGYIYAFFKVLFIFQGLRRYDLFDQEAIRKQPVRGLVIDEAQDSLLASEEGLADHRAADRLRGANCFLFYLMQSYSSPHPPIGDEKKVNALFANLGTHIVGAIKDPPGREYASKMFGEFEKKKKTHSYGLTSPTSISITTEDKPIRRPSFFLNMKKFEVVIGHVEGRTAHGIIKPLTDDGTRVAPWFRFRLFKAQF